VISGVPTARFCPSDEENPKTHPHKTRMGHPQENPKSAGIKPALHVKRIVHIEILELTFAGGGAFNLRMYYQGPRRPELFLQLVARLLDCPC
jgi:hypothetical protein